MQYEQNGNDSKGDTKTQKFILLVFKHDLNYDLTKQQIYVCIITRRNIIIVETQLLTAVC